MERLGAGRSTLGVQADRLDPRFRRVEPLGAAAAQRIAAFVQRDRLVERGIAGLQPADDRLESGNQKMPPFTQDGGTVKLVQSIWP